MNKTIGSTTLRRRSEDDDDLDRARSGWAGLLLQVDRSRLDAGLPLLLWRHIPGRPCCPWRAGHYSSPVRPANVSLFALQIRVSESSKLVSWGHPVEAPRDQQRNYISGTSQVCLSYLQCSIVFVRASWPYTRDRDHCSPAIPSSMEPGRNQIRSDQILALARRSFAFGPAKVSSFLTPVETSSLYIH